MVAVKICGVRTLAAAAACAEVSSDFAGLNFVPTARRYVDATRAKQIARELGAVRAVGVFRDASRDEIFRTVGEVSLDWIQLHGAESPELCASIREQGIGVIKAISVTSSARADFVSSVAEYRGCADVVLLDAPVAGSGVPWSWESIVSPVPFFVAGGLTPGNVAAAIAILSPDGVDVASGVESEGEIDPVKIRAFCAAARTAGAATGVVSVDAPLRSASRMSTVPSRSSS